MIIFLTLTGFFLNQCTIFTVCSHTLFLPIEKDLRECQNVSVKFPCVPFWAVHLELIYLYFLPSFHHTVVVSVL